MGKFQFSFLNYLDDLELSEKTKRSHRNNIGLIANFDAGYGYNDEFRLESLADGPDYLYQFRRKVSDSKYAIQSYESTWRKLEKYIKSGVYKEYIKTVEGKISRNE